MVNSGFPIALGYGFEMVDGLRCVRIGVNQKFTPNQTRRIFREFFAI